MENFTSSNNKNRSRLQWRIPILKFYSLVFILCLYQIQPIFSQSTTTTRTTTETTVKIITTNRTSNTAGITEEKEERGETNKPEIFQKSKSFGNLCEDGNDDVGRKLGCDCRTKIFTTDFPKREGYVADCSNRSPKLGSGEGQVPPPSFLNISSLVRKLDLSSNELTRVDSTTFNEVHNIRELSLSRNNISYVMNLNFSLLESLDLSYNQIRNLTVNFVTPNTAKEIRNLNLSHNKLTFIDIKTFDQLEYLQVLRLGYNQLENIFNYMEEYPFMLNNLTYLEELDLTNGSLIDLPGYVLEGTNNLKRLILKNNLFSILPIDAFSNLPNLEQLDMSGNYLTHLPANGFHHLSSLKTLVITNMIGLQRIEDYAFSGLGNLRVLTCQRNYLLDEISVLAFRGDATTNCSDSNPTIVELGYNKLSHIEYPLLRWQTMEEIDLQENPWVCDCNLQWVAEFAKSVPVNASILIDSDFKCNSPHPLKGTPVAAVAVEEFLCNSEIALAAEIIALIVFCILLVFFFLFVSLHHYELLPIWAERFTSACGNRHLPIPKYSRLKVPKPNEVRQLSENYPRNPEVELDLEWDPQY